MSNPGPEWYQLCHALEQGDPDAALATLEKDPGLINARNSLGENVLHFLAVENNLPGVEWLHERGADLNTVNQFGTPMLFEVALLGHKGLISWLIEHGADPEKRNAEGQRIDEYLAEFGKTAMKDCLQKVLDS